MRRGKSYTDKDRVLIKDLMDEWWKITKILDHNKR